MAATKKGAAPAPAKAAKAAPSTSVEFGLRFTGDPLDDDQVAALKTEFDKMRPGIVDRLRKVKQLPVGKFSSFTMTVGKFSSFKR